MTEMENVPDCKFGVARAQWIVPTWPHHSKWKYMKLLNNYDTQTKQGNAGLGIAIGQFSSNGYTVLIPLTDSQEYDIVVDIGGKLTKIQVKTTLNKSKYSFIVELRTKGGNKSGTGKTKLIDARNIDYLFIVDLDGNKYLIPSKTINGMSSISLGKKYEQYKLV